MANQQQPQQYKSRLSLASPAIRPGMHGRMLLSGPAGAGKTYTALLIASILAGADRVSRSIIMIDTEKDSGKTYADLFRLDDGTEGYFHLPWAAPYNATELAMTLREASEDPVVRVVIVDSHTHFWRAEGGILDVANGKWTGWGEARPMHADMIDAVLTCDAHILLCARSSMEHVQEKDDRGKITVRKVGMKVQQDAELEYEVNVALEMDMSHVMHVSKSRTLAVPVGSQFIAGHAEDFAGVYREWLVGGEPVSTLAEQEALIEVLDRIEDRATRARAKRDFIDTFGRPEMLLVSRLPQAQEWVADRLLGIDTPDRAPDDEPPDDRTKRPAPTDEERAAAQDADHAQSMGGGDGDDPHAGTIIGNSCAVEGCGHDERVHDIEGVCTGVHIQGPANTSEAVEVPCECRLFVAYDRPDSTAPASEEGATAPEGRPEPAGAQNATQPVSGDAGSEALAQSQIEAEVEQMSLHQVSEALLAAKRSANGTPKHLRRRLVEVRVKALSAQSAAKEPML